MARIGRPQGQALTLSDIERDEHERLGRSQSASHSLVRRAQIILASAASEANTSIANHLGVSNQTNYHWRKIWLEKGLDGLYGEAQSGRTRSASKASCAPSSRASRSVRPTGSSGPPRRRAGLQMYGRTQPDAPQRHPPPPRKERAATFIIGLYLLHLRTKVHPAINGPKM